MRADQYEKLKKLTEKLADVVLVESDPEAWIGKGRTLADLTKSERGDRYWEKKNAAMTMTLLMRCVSLTGHIERNGAGLPDDPLPDGETDLDKEVKQAEREARKLLERHERGRGKAN